MNIERIWPNANLANIPHMLRALAQAIEAGDHGDVEALLIVMPPEAGDWPRCFGFGDDAVLDDARVIGMLEMAKIFMANHSTSRP